MIMRFRGGGVGHKSTRAVMSTTRALRRKAPIIPPHGRTTTYQPRSRARTWSRDPAAHAPQYRNSSARSIGRSRKGTETETGKQSDPKQQQQGRWSPRSHGRVRRLSYARRTPYTFIFIDVPFFTLLPRFHLFSF